MKRRSLATWLALVALGGCDASWLETSDGRVDRGNALLAEGRAAEALAAYEEAATALPQTPELDYDRGLAATAAGEFDEGTQRLLRALDTRDPELRRRVYAALGAAYARWGEHLERQPPQAPAGEPDGALAADPRELALPKWEKAVEHLERALTASPTPDPDVLRNLEVALLRVDPPCASRNDAHEPNDVAERAAPIQLTGGEAADPQQGLVAAGPPDRLAWREQLRACPDDVDWFQLDLEAGDRLKADLTRPKDAGALSLSLFAADGQRQLAPDDGTEPGEALAITAPEAGRYLLRVDNVDDDEVAYGLAVEVRPPCARTEDRFEPNDGPGEARSVTLGQLPDLKICPGDDDWFAVTLAEGESLFAFASLEGEGEDEGAADAAAPVPLTLEVTDVDGRVLATGGPAGKARVVTVLTPGAGRYLVRVAGTAELEARYALMIQVIPPCPEGDDAFEDNDTPEAATSLDAQLADARQQGGASGPGGQAPPSWLLRICPGDDDWLGLTVEADEPVQISAVFDHDKGDLELVAYDEGGETVVTSSDQSSPESNGEAVLLEPAEDGPRAYRLLVRGKDGAENFYLLRVDRPQGGGGGGGQEDSPQDEQDPPRDDPQEGDRDGDPRDGDRQGDPQPPQQPPQQQPPRKADPLEEALDKLDRNPQNLEALETLKASPLTNHPPEKDW